jgi:uncharacterized protein (DUF58 family)
LALFLLAMLIACINYNLSLGYWLTFFIFSIALGAMSRTHQNLISVRCELLAASADAAVFAGETATIHVALNNPTARAKWALRLQWHSAHHNSAAFVICNLPLQKTVTAQLTLPCTKRGRHRVPDLKVSASYPLSLWRAWSYVFTAPETVVWVYPTPQSPLPTLRALQGSSAENHLPNLPSIAAEQGDAVSHLETSDSASTRRIHWPSLAKGALVVKMLEDNTQPAAAVQFGLQDCTLIGLEAQLSQLCGGVLHCGARAIPFCLSLGNHWLPEDRVPRCDSAHVQACLQALAVHA